MKNKEERFIYVTDGVSMFAHDRKTKVNLEFSDGMWEESGIDFEKYVKDNKKDLLTVKESEALIMTEMDPRDVVDGRPLEPEIE